MTAPEHGTASAYRNNGCRCAECRTAAAAEKRAYRRRRVEGPLLVPAGEAREHLRRLAASGVTISQVARLTGVATTTLRETEKGRQRRLTPAAVEAVVAVPLGTTAGAMRIPGEKARRLLETMAAAGVGTDEVAAALRCESPRGLALGRRTYVTRRSWERLVTLYRFLARQGLVPADLLEEVGA
jgi:transcriptional regulator with XRE-family HTH domain